MYTYSKLHYKTAESLIKRMIEDGLYFLSPVPADKATEYTFFAMSNELRNSFVTIDIECDGTFNRLRLVNGGAGELTTLKEYIITNPARSIIKELTSAVIPRMNTKVQRKSFIGVEKACFDKAKKAIKAYNNKA